MNVRILLLASTMLLFAVVSPATAGDLKDELIAREKAEWQAWANGDGEAYRDWLTEDATFAVAGDGLTTGRDAIIADISSHDCEIKDLDFADFNLRQLSPDVAVLTYTATSETTCQGQKLPGALYATSIYVRQGSEWRLASYQETALE